MDKIVKLDLEGIKELHFFVKGINFPIVAASYPDWERQQLSYLASNVQNVYMNTEAICQWCVNHKIKYQILYPTKKTSIILHPYKYLKFLQLKKKLNYSL